MDKTYTRINWQNEPSVATPINDVNLNKMDYSLNEVDNRIISLDTSKADQSDLLQTVKAVTYDTTTGVFTFTFWNGTVVTADLNIEKIPVSFSMSPEGVITMTTADGTQYTADVSELIKTYSFVDSSEIDFTVTTDSSGNKSVTASIIAGSITGEKLQPNYLADCVSAKNGAELAAGSASGSATSSELSSEDSEAWAIGERNGQPVPSTDPTYENNAKWWAQHGTGSSFAGLTDTSFTNLQNGQIAKYNSTTQKWENTEDEGGLLPHFKITSEAGSTVTVVCPDTSVIVPTQTSSGIWQCDVPAYGVYTVHAVINGDDSVRTVTVDTVKEYVIHDEHYSYTLNVYAPTGSSIIVTDGGDETYTGTGAGSTAVIFALHQASTQYTITVTYDGLTRTDSITSSATSGQSGSKTIEFGTINLTVDEDLIGETITMEKGTDTVSKVASSTSMVFYPNATGNWRISVDYEGETVYAEPDPIVVSSLSTPVSAELSLVKIPEGATVLPTDDIQTWLACAGITDKSYTTLAEVLADSTTLLALMSNNNAVDYLVRSKTWATNKGLIPVMTSATTPSGSVTASVAIGSGQAWQAFDGDNSTFAQAYWGGQYIQYEFPSAKKFSKFYIRSTQADAGYRWDTLKLQGSNDGSSFTDIANLTNTNHETDYYADVSMADEYKYFRVLFGTISGYTAINEIQFYPQSYAINGGICEDSTAMTDIGANNYCAETLLADSTWLDAICDSTYFESVLNTKVPTMTSNTTPSGEAFADDNSSNAYKMFDGSDSTVWEASNYSIDTIRGGYAFTSSVLVRKIHIKVQGGTWDSNNTIDIQYSEDNSTWNDTNIKGESLGSPAVNTEYNFIISTYNANAKYWRIVCKNNGEARYRTIFTLQFYGRADV